MSPKIPAGHGDRALGLVDIVSAGRALLHMLLLFGLLCAGVTAADGDGDGVEDALDCAPGDATVATPHRYYFDLDGDQSGDAANPADLCSSTPFPGSVLWRGDGNDSDPLDYPQAIPRGNRIVGVDFLDSSENGADVLALVDELGADAISVNVHWLLYESAPGVFDGPERGKLEIVRDVVQASGLRLNLTLSAVSPYGLVIPEDLAQQFYSGTLRLSDPQFIDRYRAALDDVHARLGGTPLVSLQIGHDIDHLIRVAQVPQLWADFEVFFSAAQAHAKSLWGSNLKVGVTATAAGLTDPVTGPVMDSINVHADLVSFTYEPHGANYQIADPALLIADLDQVRQRYPGAQLSIQTLAFPSAPATGSSRTRQSQFLTALFDYWDDYAAVLNYVGIARLFDRSPAGVAAEIASGLHVIEAGDELAAELYFGSTGLREYTGAGHAKPAYYTLRNQLFARGWPSLVEPTVRSFALALSSFAYDQVPDQALDDSVLDQLYAVIAADADMVMHHFDRGVPWTEALFDDFSSPDPPYSENVLDVWSKHRARTPAGHQVAISVNPLGVPRDRLAPYWGFGEGFYLDDELGIVGTGVSADYHDRLLPVPFDTMAFDDPAVKAAYLNYLRRIIDYFDPDYLVTGVEVNLLVDSTDSSHFDAWLELQQFVYTELKADPAYAATPLVVSIAGEFLLDDEIGVPLLIDNIQDPALRSRHESALVALAQYADVIGLSLYPTKTRFVANQIPVYVFDQLFERIGELTSKTFAITETGFPSTSFTLDTVTVDGSPEKQARYLELLLAEAQASGKVEFVTNFSARDITPYMDRLRERAAAEPPLESAALIDFFRSFEYIGLYDADGQAKPAATTFAAAAGLSYVGFPRGGDEIFLSSPDGQLVVQVGVDDSNQLFLAASLDGDTMLERSPLGIEVDGAALGSSVISVTNSLPLAVDQPFGTRGAHAVGTNNYRMSIVTVSRTDPQAESLDIEFRVFDDGVAYRYLVPGAGPRSISGERSGWTFPAGSRLRFQTSTTNYESFYLDNLIGQVSDTIGFPTTVELPADGGYVTLAEADVRGYSGMTLRAQFGTRTLSSEFLEDAVWPVDGGGTSPWRFAIIARDLNALVNSDMTARLAESPDPMLFPEGADTDWIVPGKALWSWWSDGTSGFSFDIQQEYVDQAAAMGMDYVLVDIWWEDGFPANGLDQFARLAELTGYARSDGRDIGVWVWKNFFELIDPVARHSFLDAVANAGAVGVKVDSILGQASDSVGAAALREAILEDAAARRLMVNFHGMSKPTGLARTYPNLVAEEAMAGLEINGLAWEQGLFLPAAHNATLPFTRFVLGPGDYTPITFDARKIGGTTFAHQLASAGVFMSTVLHYADSPQNLQQPAEVQDLLMDLPTSWDETLVLPDSRIGELVVMARRRNNDWWLFVLNGDETAERNLSIETGFLNGGGYEAVFIADDTATTMLRSETTVTAADTVNIDLLPGGGFVARLREIPTERPFRLGTSGVPPDFDQGWDDVFSFLGQQADLVVHSLQEGVPWPEALLSNNLGDYHPNVQNLVNFYKQLTDTHAPGNDVYLMVNPMDVTYDRKAPYWGENNRMALPAPWDSLPFNHPDMKQAFVNYLVALVEVFNPRFVAINVEANIFLAKRPLEWEQFKEFNAHVYDTMKALYPDIRFFSTIQYEHMLGMHVASRTLAELLEDSYPSVLMDEVRALLGHSDAVAISTYPYMAVEDPALIGGTSVVTPGYFDPVIGLSEEFNLPIAFEQTGWITQTFETKPGKFAVGNETMQSNFLARLFDLATRQSALFISNFVAIDYGDFFGDGLVERTWSTAGILRQDRSPKPAFQLWQNVMQRTYVAPE